MKPLAFLRSLKPQPARTSWLWCYACGHDLNGDDQSFVEEKDNCWWYICAACKAPSAFDLSYPIPVRVRP